MELREGSSEDRVRRPRRLIAPNRAPAAAPRDCGPVVSGVDPRADTPAISKVNALMKVIANRRRTPAISGRSSLTGEVIVSVSGVCTGVDFDKAETGFAHQRAADGIDLSPDAAKRFIFALPVMEAA